MILKSVLLHLYYSFPLVYFFSFLYLTTGRQPWSLGYLAYRHLQVVKAINNPKSIGSKNNGFGLDERIIEYPWVITHLTQGPAHILDAGSFLNFDYILQHPIFKDKKIIIANLNPEFPNYNNHSIGYLYQNYGDLRKLPLIDSLFDLIICGSVLEHIGLDNTKTYTNNQIYNEKKDSDYILVLKEFRRLLKPGGTCLVTVPYGKHNNYGWMQQFDQKMIKGITKIFDSSSVTIYRYTNNGWQLSTLKESSNCQNFDYKCHPITQVKKQAASEAIACIELHRKNNE